MHTDELIRYHEYVKKILASLELQWSLLRAMGWEPVAECPHLISIGLDIHNRIQYLHPKAAMAWHRMQQAARAQGIVLQMVSAFRSVNEQQRIWERKRERGLQTEAILAYSAPPGFSEHHSGRAVDVGTCETKPLERDFENSAAFTWLLQHASAYGFHLSYPENHPLIAYEPWHWCYAPEG